MRVRSKLGILGSFRERFVFGDKNLNSRGEPFASLETRRLPYELPWKVSAETTAERFRSTVILRHPSSRILPKDVVRRCGGTVAASTGFVSATRLARRWVVDKLPARTLRELRCLPLDHECHTFSTP